jgi:serine/threonine protein phosphatase PrpC
LRVEFKSGLVVSSKGDKALMQDVGKVVTREIPILKGTIITHLTAVIADGHGEDGEHIAQAVVDMCAAIQWNRLGSAEADIQSQSTNLGSEYAHRRDALPFDRHTIASATTAAVTLVRYDEKTRTSQARFGVIGNCAILHLHNGEIKKYTHDNEYAQIGENNEGVWMFWDCMLSSGDTIVLASDGMGEISDRDVQWVIEHNDSLRGQANELLETALHGTRTSATDTYVPCYDNVIITIIKIP